MRFNKGEGGVTGDGYAKKLERRGLTVVIDKRKKIEQKQNN